jgi:alkylation response protein AidB-like acyl-CoA dehydrogenase
MADRRTASMKDAGLHPGKRQRGRWCRRDGRAGGIDAMQVFGGYGYVGDFPIRRIYRDVRVCQICEGTSDIQKILVARAL